MEKLGNKIICEAGMELEMILNNLAMIGIYEPTDEMLNDLMIKGEYILEVKKDESSQNFLKEALNPEVKKEQSKKDESSQEDVVVEENDFFDFEEEENNETIGEYMSYVFVDGWNISKAQVRRGIAVEETALEFLSNGKCKMSKRTVSGPTINYLRGIASEIRPNVTGMDGKIYSTVITKEEKGVKIIRFTVAEETGDVMITYFLKQRETLAKERELAMWR